MFSGNLSKELLSLHSHVEIKAVKLWVFKHQIVHNKSHRTCD